VDQANGLRGKSREFDEGGVCGTQKLVVTGDLTLLMRNLQRVFPGAKVTSEQGALAPERGKKTTKLDALLRHLSTGRLPSRVETKQIGDHFGRQWREFSGDLTKNPEFNTLLDNAGWRYVRRRGSAGAYFERLEEPGVTLGDEEALRAHRRRLLDLIWRQAL
jgi:hypothetical protein